jgi:hypothetical protein
MLLYLNSNWRNAEIYSKEKSLESSELEET